MQNSEFYDLCILGGGFTGCALAAQLCQTAKRPLSIALINASHPTFQGIAYSTLEPYHLLNVPAGKMSLYADKPNDFIDWLNDSVHKDMSLSLPEQFAPRMLYGQYIQERFLSAKKNSAANCEVIEDEVLALSQMRSAITIKLKNARQKSIKTQKVVLALGNAKPYNLLAQYQIQEDTPNYIANPWDFNQLSRLSTTDDILIIGSGLTTVDCLLTLQHMKHRGKIDIVSKHGFMPKAHENFEAPPLTHDLNTFKTAKSSWAYVKAQIKQHQNWRVVIDSLRPYTQSIWQAWPNNEKRTFLRHIRAYWDVHRHRIAPQIAAQIKTLFDSGQVNCFAGHLSNASVAKESFSVEYLSRKNGQKQSLYPKVIVNATGPNYVSYMDHPLIQSLISQRIVAWDTFKLGLRVNQNSQLLDANNEVQPNMFAMGPLTKSQFWEIIAVPDIRVQVQNVAKSLLEN